jgi:hypothetical protein
VVLSTDSLQKYESGFGGAAAVIGRVANRIAARNSNSMVRPTSCCEREEEYDPRRDAKGFAQSVWTGGGTFRRRA